MKQAGNSTVGLAGVGNSLLAVLAAATVLSMSAFAATSAVNPYAGIIERNTFGLKPPINPADLVKPPPPVVADIKLQGFTTILGKKQVLMRVKVPARPPEPAREQSFVFVEGQREGEVEVKEIDPVAGSVKVDNAGTLLTLNMKEHGDKPAPGAAPAAPGAVVQPTGLPTPNVPAPAPASTSVTPANTGVSVSSFGGNGNEAFRSSPALPQRALRTGGNAGMATLPAIGNSQSTGQGGYQPPASPLSVDEQMAVLAVQHAASGQGSPTSGLLPPLPAKYRQGQ